MPYQCLFGSNPTTTSEDTLQTRKCHANAKANRIRTKHNMSPPLWCGDIIVALNVWLTIRLAIAYMRTGYKNVDVSSPKD